MPYVLNSGTSCGQNSVNSGYYAGRLDGFTIVMGHEIEETVTDPGAEDVINGAEPRRLVRLQRLGERRQVRLGRLHGRHHRAARPSRAA